MGKPPQSGSPAFRFTSSEVAEMEAFLQENKVVPTREIVCSIAEKFSASPDRAGKIVVQSKQVWNWFQNRRYAQKAKLTKAPGKLNVSSMPQDDLCFNKTRIPVSAGRTHSENYVSIGYEAKSAKDGAWYDVGSFINNRKVETGNPEVLVRFGGFGEEEDEWLDVRTQIRPSSIPCEPSECAVVLPGDLILCFLEGKEQALYMDAHVVDVQRWRHDVRGCRCRFTVRYDHDQSEEVVSLRKLCRRPETDFRLQLMYASKDLGSVNLQDMKKDPSLGGTSKDFNSPKTRKNRRQKGKASEMVVNTIPSSGTAEPITTEAARIMKTENFDDGKVGISGERIGGAPPVIFSTAATSTGSGSGGFGGSGTGAGKST